MKNNLKFTLSLAFVSLLGIGCKKNFVEPLPKPSTEQNGIRLQTAVKIRAVGFQAEQDDAGVLSLKNIPANTKQFIVITDGNNVRTQTTKTLWAAAASGDSKQITNEAVKNMMTVRQATSFKSCKTEVFALDSELLPEEMDQLKTMTRETFKAYCQDPNTKVTLLGSTVATDAIKALENSIKTTQRAIERAKIAKQKAEEKFAAGNATRKSLTQAESILASLESKLAYLKKELLDHQEH